MFALNVCQQTFHCCTLKSKFWFLECFVDFRPQPVLVRTTRARVLNIELKNAKLCFIYRNMPHKRSLVISQNWFFASKSSFVMNSCLKFLFKKNQVWYSLSSVNSYSTQRKYLTTYRLCFWYRHKIFQSNSVQFPQHFVWFQEQKTTVFFKIEM